MTRKVAVQCVRSKLAWQKVFRQLISLQKKQSVTFVHKLVDSSHLAVISFFLEVSLLNTWTRLSSTLVTLPLYTPTINILFFLLLWESIYPRKKRCHFTLVVLYLSTMTFFSVFKLAAGMSFCCPLFIITWQSVQPFARLRVKVNGKLLG